MFTALKPAGRLTTQNLVISAGVATEGHHVDWPAIEDLSTLIDLFCMYDSATVLGRPNNDQIPFELGNLLLSSRFLNIDSPGGDTTEHVSAAARSHLLAYLGGDEDDSFDGLLQVALSPGEAIYGLQGEPDRSHEVAEGEAWLKAGGTRSAVLDQLRREGRVGRSTTFVVRSFLYLGYGDVTGLVFVPDAVRVPVVGQVVAAEQELRDKLIKTMTGAVSPRMQPKGMSLERVSPLAAVVFGRAQSDRKRIVPELKMLREELAPLRKRLRKAEQKVFFGRGDEVVDATNDWNLINEELRRSFGSEPHLVSVDQVLSFGQDTGEAGDNPLKAKAWMKLLMGLPFDVARRTILRRKAVELHRLRREVPAVGTLQNAIATLFGSRIGE